MRSTSKFYLPPCRTFRGSNPTCSSSRKSRSPPRFLSQFRATADAPGRYSLGVDTYKDDPITQFQITKSAYAQMGELIAGAKKPTLFCMEGAAVWTFFQTQTRSSDGTLGIVQAATIRKRSGHAFEACWRAFRAQQGDEQHSKRSSSPLMKALDSRRA